MTIRKLVGLLSMFMVGMAALGIPPSSRGLAVADTRPHVPPELRERTEREGRVRVLVKLRLPYGAHVAERRLRSALAIAVQRADIADTQAQILSRLRWRAHRLLHRYRTVPFLAMEVSPRALAELEAAPHHVAAVFEDRLSDALLAESAPLIEADLAAEGGLDGSGTVVAILDTGVEGEHPFLAGKVVEEACYSSAVPGVTTSLCPNGEETQTGPGAGIPCTLGSCWHGTHVAGIAAGDGAAAGLPFSGVARGARIMAVQVFSRFDRSGDCGGSAPCVRAFDSDVIAGLERVYLLRSSHNFAAVNLSLGGGLTTRHCDDEPHKEIIDNLRSAGIATVIAAGNGGFRFGIAFPACVSSAVSVASTTKSDAISSFSNLAPFVSLLAPGSGITSAGEDGSLLRASGTSMAAPHVAGAFAVLKQGAPESTVSAILAALQDTGVPITDSQTATVRPRIRIAQALAALGNAVPTLAVTLSADRTIGPAPLGGVDLTATVSGTADGPITYTFYCDRSDTGTDVTPGFAAQLSGTTINPRVAVDVCTYANPGTYTAKVIAERDSLAAQAQITVTAGAAPPTAVTTAPSGTVSTLRPVYQWNAAARATSYTVQANLNGGAAVFVRTVTPAQAGCATGTSCSFTPDVDLTSGQSYAWWVLARNDVGTSPAWSPTLTFTVALLAPLPPATAITIAPTGTIATLRPVYQWNAAARATSYTVQANHGGALAFIRTVTAAEAGCATGTSCSFAPDVDLASGQSYAWWVLARNDVGTSPAWSPTLTFSVALLQPLPPATAVSTAPTGPIATFRPTYQWNAAARASTYTVQANHGGALAFIRTVTAAEAGCATGTSCSFTPDVDLANGQSYDWWVLARNDVGTSPAWSRTLTFSVALQPLLPPATAVTIAPTGTIATLRPVYQWNAAARATSYTVQANHGGALAFIRTVTAAEAGCATGTSCSFTPDVDLANGQSYAWWVLARNDIGTSPAWSPTLTFSVALEPLLPPTTAMTIAPTGTVATLRPTYQWNAAARATSYTVQANLNGNAAVFVRTVTPADAGCASGGTCSFTPDVDLVRGESYAWWVLARNDFGTSPTWSPTRSFTVSPTASAALAPAYTFPQ